MTVEDYIAALDEPLRSEIAALDELIRARAPQLEVEAAGAMIGYGPYHYRYATGREGDTHLLSLAARKHGISLYVMCTEDGEYLAQRFADRLPKADIGKSCVRFKRLSDVDLDAVGDLVAEAARIGPPPSAG